MQASDLEPLSPELVLVCPELRELALQRERAALPHRAPVAAMGDDLVVVTAAARPSARPLTAVVLAVSLALTGYTIAREAGNGGDVRAEQAPSFAPQTAISESAARALGAEGAFTAAEAPLSSTRERVSARAPAQPAAPKGQVEVELSADGLYVTSFESAACPALPNLPWLLIESRRFAWSGELSGVAVSLAGSLLPGDRVVGEISYSGPRCTKTVSFSTRALRAS